LIASRYAPGHAEEWFDDAGEHLQYKPFLQKADGEFVLRAEGRPEVRCRTSGMFVTHGSEKLREFEVVISPDEFAEMASGVAYTLHSSDTHQTRRRNIAGRSRGSWASAACPRPKKRWTPSWSDWIGWRNGSKNWKRRVVSTGGRPAFDVLSSVFPPSRKPRRRQTGTRANALSTFARAIGTDCLVVAAGQSLYGG
jgi:hypothetical protein